MDKKCYKEIINATFRLFRNLNLEVEVCHLQR